MRILILIAAMLAVRPAYSATTGVIDLLGNAPKTIQETGDPNLSNSPIWWVNSGGYFFIEKSGDGIVGRTILGSLPDSDRWRKAYASPKSNPRDTDNGYHPQNIFRLVSLRKWKTYEQKMEFYAENVRTSSSPERDSWSGILLFNHYANENNLYYAGVRDDGHIVIKKKSGGKYFTISHDKQVFAGKYDRMKNPSLIPVHKWIGMSCKVRELNNKVIIQLSLKIDDKWKQVDEVCDAGEVGGKPILGAGSIGIRGDFRDFKVRNYSVTP